MRLLHVVPTYLPATRYGGPIWSVHGLARSLVARGHEVDVYTTNLDGPGRLEVPLGVPVPMDGVRVWYFDISWVALCWVRGMAQALREWSGGWDLVHAHSVFLWPGIAAGRAAARHGVPFVLSPRGMLVPELIAARRAWAKRAWIGLFERRNIARAAALHLTSASEARDVQRCGLGTARQTVVPNGVDLPPTPRRAPRPGHLLYLGRLSWKKNLHALLEALSTLPEMQLTLAGPDDEGLWPGLAERAQALGCAGRVQWVGAVDGRRKAELFAQHACLVLCSLNENFGNVVIEAMAHACPVLVTPGVGCAQEVRQGGAGAVAQAADAQAIRAALQGLLGSEGLAEAQGQSGRRHVEAHLSWPVVGQAMEALYRSCLGART